MNIETAKTMAMTILGTVLLYGAVQKFQEVDKLKLYQDELMATRETAQNVRTYDAGYPAIALQDLVEKQKALNAKLPEKNKRLEMVIAETELDRDHFASIKQDDMSRRYYGAVLVDIADKTKSAVYRERLPADAFLGGIAEAFLAGLSYFLAAKKLPKKREN